MKKLLVIALFFISAQAIEAQCYTDRHSTSWKDAWVSCATSMSPNPIRGESHWIQYDLGAKYGLGQFHFWNYNQPDSTARGIRDIIIDYSLDGGVNWVEWGTHTIEEANGSAIYEGDLGPDFRGLGATAILITATSNYGGSCYALGEIKIDIAELSNDEEILVEDFGVTISPNPADGHFVFALDSELATRMSYTLYNTEGKLILQGAADLSAGPYTKEIITSALPSDTYFLEIAKGNQRTIKKISVSH